MKNYIYIKTTQWSTEIYYARANTKDNAMMKIARESDTSIHQYHIVSKEMKELKHCEQVLYLEKENYEG